MLLSDKKEREREIKRVTNDLSFDNDGAPQGANDLYKRFESFAASALYLTARATRIDEFYPYIDSQTRLPVWRCRLARA